MANKHIDFTYDGKDYTLEFDRASVRQMERTGFRVGDIYDKPATAIPDLFAGAFNKNHPTVKREKRDKIYEALTGKQTLLDMLIDMYNETLESLIDEESGNVSWTPSWTPTETEE